MNGMERLDVTGGGGDAWDSPFVRHGPWSGPWRSGRLGEWADIVYGGYGRQYSRSGMVGRKAGFGKNGSGYPACPASGRRGIIRAVVFIPRQDAPMRPPVIL